MTDAPVVVVLAGGANSRFWPLEHKSLFPFLGEPLLSRHIRLLGELGFQDFIIVANPENATVLGELTGGLAGPRIELVVQPESRGMHDALLCAEPVLRGQFSDRAIYVTQVHDVADQELHAVMLRSYRSGAAHGYLPARRTEKYLEGGYLVLDGPRVTGIVEKPGAGNEPSPYFKLVADLFAGWQPLFEAIKGLESSGGDDIYERAITELCATHAVVPAEYHKPIYTIKFPWHVLDVMDFFLSGDFVTSRIAAATGGEPGGVYVSPGAQVAPDANLSGEVYIAEGVQLSAGVIIQGPVFLDRDVRLGPRTTVMGPAYLGPGARMFPGSLVSGPSYVGARAVMGNNSLVRASMVEAEANVGFGTEVARSYVGSRCELHTNYVGDSILAEGVHMGSGAVTANLKLNYRTIRLPVGNASGKVTLVDTGRMKLGLIAGRDAQMGINASIMPGRRLGRGSIVGAAVMLDRDLRDNRFVRLRWTGDGSLRCEETDANVSRPDTIA